MSFIWVCGSIATSRGRVATYRPESSISALRPMSSAVTDDAVKTSAPSGSTSQAASRAAVASGTRRTSYPRALSAAAAAERAASSAAVAYAVFGVVVTVSSWWIGWWATRHSKPLFVYYVA